MATGLDLFGGLGITQSRINQYSFNPADVGKWAPYVPNMTVNGGAQYRTDIVQDSLGLVLRADYRLLGKQYWDTENDTARNPVNLVGLSVGLEDDNGRWNASVRADNVFNTQYNAEYVSGGYVEPAIGRVVRGTVRLNF